MNKGKRLLKVLAGVIGFGIIGILVWITVSFTGDPVSALLATSGIRRYVAETYPGRGFETDWASYSFKTGDYFSMVRDPESPDTVFSVSWRGGEIRYDNYSFEVEECNTTLRRFSEEYDRLVEEAVSRDFPYETELCYGDLQLSGKWPGLRLDAVFSLEEIPGGTVCVWVTGEKQDIETMAECLLALDAAMEKAGIPVERYSLSLWAPEKGGGLSVFDYPAEQVLSDGLADRLEQYLEEWDGTADTKENG